jgi:hypothetical protein
MVPTMARDFSLLNSLQTSSQSPSNLLCNGYWKLYPWGYSNSNIKVATHIHLLLRLRMVKLHLDYTYVFMV